VFPIFSQNLIFRFLQNSTKVQIWLYENQNVRIEGKIIGFDEYMNLVVNDAEEVNQKNNGRKKLGKTIFCS
jgi:small nuclear ribonucleoprotein E